MLYESQALAFFDGTQKLTQLLNNKVGLTY